MYMYHSVATQGNCKAIFNLILTFFYSFNRLDLPPYESYDKLFDKLSLAVNHTIGFYSE